MMLTGGEGSMRYLGCLLGRPAVGHISAAAVRCRLFPALSNIANVACKTSSSFF